MDGEKSGQLGSLRSKTAVEDESESEASPYATFPDTSERQRLGIATSMLRVWLEPV